MTKSEIQTNIKPIFADEASVNANIKINVEKTEKGDIIRKVGKVEILFLDQITRSVVSRVVVDPFTAKVLGKVLINNSDRIIKEIENKEIPEEVKKQIAEKESQQGKPSVNTYIG